MDLDNDAQCGFSFACQVLEYHPQPWDEWVTIGYLQQDRYNYATLSIGPEELPCLLSGESFKMEMISKVIGSRWLIDKQRGDNDNDNEYNASI